MYSIYFCRLPFYLKLKKMIARIFLVKDLIQKLVSRPYLVALNEKLSSKVWQKLLISKSCSQVPMIMDLL